MKLRNLLFATGAVAGALWTTPAHAAAKGYVVVVAEGLSPQVASLGQGYLRKTDEDAEETTAFDDLAQTGQSAPISGDVLKQMQGLLAQAKKGGYKTGLVTTGDLTRDAALFFGIPGDAATALTAADPPYDFLAGGGRASLGPNAKTQVEAAGGTYLASEEELDTEVKGRVLAPQASGDLDFAIDRNPEEQAGLTELSTLALDTLGAGETPFVLVIHDTLLEKALQTKDSPALFEQFRELDAVVSDAAARREENPDLKLAVVLGGGAVTPRFTTPDAAQQGNAFFVLSNLTLSYAGAARALKGATDESLTAFADPDEGQYKGWKVSDATRQGLLAGTLDPESAVRASYEPVLGLEYAPQSAAPVAYTLGFSAPQGLVSALQDALK